MTPTVALLLVGGGAVAIWILTSPGGLSGLLSNGIGGGTGVPVNSAGRPFLDEKQINYYMSPFGTTHLTSAQAAAIGAQAGAPIAGLTFGISVGIGALAGWLSVRNSNDTKEDRIAFAKLLGFPSGLNVASGHNTPLSSDQDTSKGLLPYLVGHGYHDSLVVAALNVIGRKDFEGNARWGLDVLVALWQSNYPFPR